MGKLFEKFKLQSGIEFVYQNGHQKLAKLLDKK